MCGRYTQLMSWRELVELYNLTNIDFRPNLPARYNLAPTQDAPIVRLAQHGDRELAIARWGLIPGWAKERSIGARLINARAEGVADSGAFRNAYRQRRCLVPASGFFEWQGSGSSPRQPYYITLADGAPMTFAGLWERWRDPADGRTVESYTILTTEANALLRPIHAKHRMPVILQAATFDLWLDPTQGDPTPLLRPYPAEDMIATPVSSAVNKAWDSTSKSPVDHPGLIEPLPSLL
ncbi:MAG: SOS response-associated peptidase [Kiloniellales bacterium]